MMLILADKLKRTGPKPRNAGEGHLPEQPVVGVSPKSNPTVRKIGCCRPEKQSVVSLERDGKVFFAFEDMCPHSPTETLRCVFAHFSKRIQWVGE